jgi:hypothetical protein
MNETPTPQGQSRSETGATERDKQIARETATEFIREGATYFAFKDSLGVSDLDLTKWLESKFLSAITRARKARAEQSAPAAEQWQDLAIRARTELELLQMHWSLIVGHYGEPKDLEYRKQSRESVCQAIYDAQKAAPSPAQEKRGDWSLEEMYGRMLVAAGVVGLTHDEAVAETKRLCDLARAAQEKKPVEASVEEIATQLYRDIIIDLPQLPDSHYRKIKSQIEAALATAFAALREQLEQAQKFKAFVHDYLTQHGIPEGDPTNQHQLEGCRIGARLDLLFAQVANRDAALRQKDEALRELRNAISDFKGHGMPGFTDRCVAYLVMDKADKALAIQPGSSALNTFIEAATAPLRATLLDCARVAAQYAGEYGVGAKVEAVVQAALAANRNLSLDSPSQQTTGVSVTKESGAPSGQTVGVATQKAGQP